MTRRIAKPVLSGRESLLDIGNAPREKLLALKAEVEPDGSATLFTYCFTNGPAFDVMSTLEELAPTQNTICQAANLMVNRSSLAPDGGNSRLLEACAVALEPLHTEFIVDPVTGDRLIIYQFQNHAPLTIRLPIDEVESIRARYLEAIARSLN
jgi:hypothetical protein